MRRQLASYSPLRAHRLLAAAKTAVLAPERTLAELEARLAARFDAPLVLLTDSGTHALQIAMELAQELRPGGPMALPAYSCFDLVTAAAGAHVPVMFYDIDPISLAPDMTSLAAGLRPEGQGRTKYKPPVAVVAGNLYGFPLDWTELRSATHGAGALLIEDAAQGMGSGWKGRKGGSFGDLTVLSFGRGKGWTGGGGGALLVRHPQIIERAQDRASDLLSHDPFSGTRTWSLSMAQWLLGRPWLYALPNLLPGLELGETVYSAPSSPRSMPPAAAATILAHEDLAFAEVDVRRLSVEKWSEQGLDMPSATFCRPLDRGRSSYLRIPVLVPDPEVRDRLLERGRWLGVSPGYPLPLSRLEAVKALWHAQPSGLGGAEQLARELITLPSHSLVSRTDRRRLLELLRAAKGFRL